MPGIDGTWIQIHQLNSLPDDRDSLSELINLVKEFRFGGLLLKAFDGDAFMGSEIAHPDTRPDAIRSIAQIANQKARCDAAGVGYGVWVNPRHPDDFGLDLDFIDLQARLYAQAANAAGVIVFDSEDGAGFWGGNRPVGHARRLMEGFRIQSRDSTTVWQPDGRRTGQHLQRLRPEEWAFHMNVYAPQAYWTDFQRPFDDVLREQFETFEAIKGLFAPGAVWRPTIPGASQPGDLLDGMTLAAEEQQASGCIIFQLSSMRDANFDIVRQAAGVPQLV